MISVPHPKTPKIRLWWFLATASLALGAWAQEAPKETPKEASEKPARSATSGYVSDSGCAICHSEIYQAYQEVGMARSFYRPSAEVVIEDFDENNRYFHERGQSHYEMTRQGDRVFFSRHQVGPDGQPIHVFKQEVHWILGSGNHSRTYLFQTESGELYQLPIAWYTQTSSWAMAPGFDQTGFVGVARQVRRECMFCHNAYPDVAAGSDTHFSQPVFPADLPEGTGCQRCHGPAEEHLKTVTTDLARARSTIVNPGRLPPRLRDDVCDQCHLQPSVALFGIRRFGRADFSYRPGESLADYLVHVDVDTEGEERSERFEINHHPYRLRQSQCWQESDRELSCLTCHDPHRKVPPEERAAHYRRACLTCHQVDSCQLEAMSADAALSKTGPSVDPEDCAACHMQKRRTQDVVHVVMTDHLIRRQPAGPELLAPRDEITPILVNVELLDQERGPSGPLGEVYRAAAARRAGQSSAVDYLRQQLALSRPEELEPRLDIANGLIGLNRYQEAVSVLTEILERDQNAPRAREWLALAYSRLGRTDDATAVLRSVSDNDPTQAMSADFNLGTILNTTGKHAEAKKYLERTVQKRPTLAPGWFQLGVAQDGLGHSAEAIESFRKSITIDPSYRRGYLELGRLLIDEGRRDEALRYWRHGVKVAVDPQPISDALKTAESMADDGW